MQPVTIPEIMELLANVYHTFDVYIFMAFTLMAASSVSVLVRRLFVGAKQ